MSILRTSSDVSISGKSTIKSGKLFKKGSGPFGKQYSERLFELKQIGKIDYFELKADGKKNSKGSIMLSSSTEVELRPNNNNDNEHKFIIKNLDRDWYLWCKTELAAEDVDEWVKEINKIIHKLSSTTDTIKLNDMNGHSDQTLTKHSRTKPKIKPKTNPNIIKTEPPPKAFSGPNYGQSQTHNIPNMSTMNRSSIGNKSKRKQNKPPPTN
eukprot:509805_1